MYLASDLQLVPAQARKVLAIDFKRHAAGIPVPALLTLHWTVCEVHHIKATLALLWLLTAVLSGRFNEVRNNKPKLAKYRWQNIGWYFYEAMATGWFLGAKPLRKKIAKLRVSKPAVLLC